MVACLPGRRPGPASVSTDWWTRESPCESASYAVRYHSPDWQTGRMATVQLADRDAETVNDIADWLAIAYLRLHRAAAIAQHLAVTDPDYRDRPGWDLALAIHEAITAIDHIARVQDLAARNGFWAQPLGPAAVASANAHATMPSAATVAAGRLLAHLGAAFDALLGAGQETSCPDTDLDEALYAVCNALRAAITHPEADLDAVWEITI